MLKIFRKNQFLRSLLLLPLALVLNLNLLFDVPSYIAIFHTTIDTWCQKYFNEHNPFLHWLIYSLLIFICATLINRWVIIHRLSNTITLLPGVFFIVLISIFPKMAGLNSISIALLFYCLMLSNLMYIYARQSAADKVFNVGLYTGIMSVLFGPFVMLLLFLCIAINIMTSLRMKMFLNLLNGFFIPFYFILVAYFWNDWPISGFVDQWSAQFGWANLELPLTTSRLIALVFFILLLLFVFITHPMCTSKKSIQIGRKIVVLAWSLIFSLIIYVISGVRGIQLLSFMMPAIAFYISEGVLRFKNERNAELVFVLLIMLCAVMPFVL